MRRRIADETGETLAELIVAMAILGLAVVGIVGAVGVAAMTTTVNRESGTASTVLRSFAELIQAEPLRCGDAYPTPRYGSEGQIVHDLTADYQFTTDIEPQPCVGNLQKLVLTVRSVDQSSVDQISLRLEVLKRGRA